MRARRSSRQCGMLAIPFIILLVILGIAAAVLIGLAIRSYFSKGVEAVDKTVCGCGDKEDIKNRINEANAAIGEYQRMKGELSAYDAGRGKTTMYSERFFADGQGNVQLAINAVTKPGAHSLKGDTMTDCTTKVSAVTACMKNSAQAHENVHAKTCKEKKAGKGASDMSNYKKSMSMQDIWDDEIAGYRAEVSYLNEAMGVAEKDKCEWICNDNKQAFKTQRECELGCRGGLGKNIMGMRCKKDE